MHPLRKNTSFLPVESLRCWILPFLVFAAVPLPLDRCYSPSSHTQTHTHTRAHMHACTPRIFIHCIHYSLQLKLLVYTFHASLFSHLKWFSLLCMRYSYTRNICTHIFTHPFLSYIHYYIPSVKKGMCSFCEFVLFIYTCVYVYACV